MRRKPSASKYSRKTQQHLRSCQILFRQRCSNRKSRQQKLRKQIQQTSSRGSQ